MSSIPTKQIDGDVAVGRDVNIGGKATIRGSAKVGHNLTVDGWLEAKNIKGPNKGLFKTAEQLREAYPNPQKGWWALVTIEGSAASDHLGQLYVADGGTWVAQVDSNGNPLLRGNPTVDSSSYIDAYLDTLKPWLRGSLGSFDTSEAFNTYLNRLSYDTLKSGRYMAYIGGVPHFVTFSLINVKEQISVIWIEGSLMVRENTILFNTGEGVTIAYRYYKNGAWGVWKTIYDDLNGAVASQGSRISTLEGKMPTVQTSANGTNKNYIYSASGDDMHTAVSCKMWTYTHTDGNLFLRFKKWGANNDTDQQDVCQVMLTGRVSNDRWGLMNPYVYARLNNHTLTEGQSTLDTVKVNYTRFDDSGNKVLTLTKATTAKAGVMTAADKTYIDVIRPWLIGSLGDYETSDEFNSYLDSLSYDSLKSGQYVAKVGGIPFYVTHVCTSTADKRATMWVMGSLYIEEGKIRNDSDAGARIAYRSYKNDAWNSWDIMGDSISASIKVSQLDTYFMKEDSDGSVVVDIEKCEKAKPIYVVMDDNGNRVGLLFTHSDTVEHCLTLNLLTHLALNADGSLNLNSHSHRYDYPKIYKKNLGFYFTSNAETDDPGYFEELKTSKWYCPLDEQFKKNVPTLQRGAVGDEKKYIYSHGGSDGTHTVLSGNIWIYKHGDYNQFLRFKHWGGVDDTQETDYSQVMLPNAWTGGNGLMRYDIYRRLDAFELREQNSTATEIKIITPIFTSGGTRELSISQATTAKAGVMTAADKTKLDGLSSEGVRAAEALNAAIGDMDLFGHKNIFDTNNNRLGGKVTKEIYDLSTPTEYTKGSPFEVFCTQGIKSNIHSEKYMIWFGLRKSTTNIERYSCQQVIGQTEDDFYHYENRIAFRLNNGKVYEPYKGSPGLVIEEITNYQLSDKTPYIMTIADMRLLYQIKQKLNL